MIAEERGPKGSIVKLALVLPLAALVLAGCKTTGSSTLLGGSSTSSPAAASQAPDVRAVAKWGQRWEKNPGDPQLTVGYVTQLRRLGAHDKALSVLQDATKTNPGSTTLQGELGKQLATAGKNQEASVVLQRAAAAPDATWQIHSRKGVVLDRLGRHKDAQAAYRMALQKSPGQISAMNNLGLSQAQDGQLKQAEGTLRRAYATPAGRKHSRLRQNLALVVGLHGRFEEAKTIVKADLPPQQVEQNIAYLRSMLAQPDPWKKLSKLDKKKT